MARYKFTNDPRERHVRLFWIIVDSNAWRCLSATDQRVYVALRRGLSATNNGNVELTLKGARPHGIKSKTTLAKSLRALCAVGLIAVTRKGGCKRGGQRLPTLYRFTDAQVYEIPAKHVEAHRPSNEWEHIQTLAQGRHLIREAEAKAAELAAMKKSQGQKMTHTGSENGPFPPLTGSNSGPWITRPGQKMDHGKRCKNTPKANDDAGFVDSDEIANSKNHGPHTGLPLYNYQVYSDSGGGGRRKFIVAGSGKPKTPDGLEAVMTP